MNNSLISVSPRDKLPLNYVVVNTKSYYNTADMLQIDVLFYAVLSYSCTPNQGDVPAMCHVWLPLSLTRDFTFSKTPLLNEIF